jgi:hypothetical protein
LRMSRLGSSSRKYGFELTISLFELRTCLHNLAPDLWHPTTRPYSLVKKIRLDFVDDKSDLNCLQNFGNSTEFAVRLAPRTACGLAQYSSEGADHGSPMADDCKRLLSALRALINEGYEMNFIPSFKVRHKDGRGGLTLRGWCDRRRVSR